MVFAVIIIMYTTRFCPTELTQELGTAHTSLTYWADAL
jgi:hypothetical protein